MGKCVSTRTSRLATMMVCEVTVRDGRDGDAERSGDSLRESRERRTDGDERDTRQQRNPHWTPLL
jgi:hypothetical protein